MSSICYYSNYCEKSKNLLHQLSKSPSKKEIHFICIDKRSQNKEGKMIIHLENNQNVVLPNSISKVPALLLLNQGHRVVFGNEILEHLKPDEDLYNAKATQNNMEPLSYSLGNDNIGGFGVMSDSFSFWDQNHEEMLAEGNGGTRQMYNYAALDQSHVIETPPDTYSPDKVGNDVTLDSLQSERNKDINQGQKRM